MSRASQQQRMLEGFGQYLCSIFVRHFLNTAGFENSTAECVLSRKEMGTGTGALLWMGGGTIAGSIRQPERVHPV